jgi:PAS domain S-box-containing protein
VIMKTNKGFKHDQFEQLNQALFHNHPDAIYMLDLAGNFTMVNEEVCRISGISREHLIGHNFSPLIEESLKTNTQERFQLAVQDKPQRYETAIVTKDGIKYLDVTNFPLKSDNEVKAVFGIAKDITEKKHRELELQEYTATLKVHNDELEVFRKILAHDLRRPVANALGFARLLLNNLQPDKESEVKRLLLQTVESIDTMVRDLNELISLQSTGHEIKEEINVHATIKKIITFFQTDLRMARATVTLDIQPDLKIKTIKAYFNSVVRNLISNAIKYRHKDRQAEIHIRATLVANNIEIVVQDNGIGMDLEKIGTHLFQMHQRFAPRVAEGNGLGLYIAKQQVTLMGGELSVTSIPDKGSEFRIILPL